MFVWPIKDLEDLNKFKNYIRYKFGYKHYAYVVFGLNTALRSCEELPLKWSDIEKDGPLSGFREKITIIEDKTQKRREIFLNDPIVHTLSKLRQKYPNDIYVFQSEEIRYDQKGVVRPWAYTSVLYFLKESAEAIGLPEHIGTHTLRKTFAYHAYKKDKNTLIEIMNILGHSEPALTLRYIAISKEESYEIYKKLQL